MHNSQCRDYVHPLLQPEPLGIEMSHRPTTDVRSSNRSPSWTTRGGVTEASYDADITGRYSYGPLQGNPYSMDSSRRLSPGDSNRMSMQCSNPEGLAARIFREERERERPSRKSCCLLNLSEIHALALIGTRNQTQRGLQSSLHATSTQPRRDSRRFRIRAGFAPQSGKERRLGCGSSPPSRV